MIYLQIFTSLKHCRWLKGKQKCLRAIVNLRKVYQLALKGLSFHEICVHFIGHLTKLIPDPTSLNLKGRADSPAIMVLQQRAFDWQATSLARIRLGYVWIHFQNMELFNLLYRMLG